METQRRGDAETDAERFAAAGEVDGELNQISEAVIGACIEVHRELGPGLLESMYESAVCHEFDLRGIRYQRQVEIPVTYKGKPIGKGYIDLIVEGKVIVELKACESLSPVHRSQVICYLQLTGLTLGLLINFNVAILTNGIKRVILSK
jgi:GxxExxY protein